MDEYYYYAAAIFLISVFSITTTVVETRSVSCSNMVRAAGTDNSADDAPPEGNLSL
jgi:hypothetical protein